MTFTKPEPDAADRETFVVKDHLGELLILSDYSIKYDFPSVYGVGGVTSAIIADTLIVDGPGAGKLYPQTAILGQYLVKDIESLGRDTGPILARLSQAKAKPGKKGAYIFKYDATPAEEAKAEKLLQPATSAPATDVPF